MNTYKRRRLPHDTTSYPVWLYFRFSLGTLISSIAWLGRHYHRELRVSAITEWSRAVARDLRLSYSGPRKLTWQNILGEFEFKLTVLDHQAVGFDLRIGLVNKALHHVHDAVAIAGHVVNRIRYRSVLPCGQ